jgi:hypothetical protein
MRDVLLPTSLVGSYAQPDWLIDRQKLAGRFPPRVRAWELWRVDPKFLEEAQDDATVLAIRDQERAGLDIITDGEQRRETTLIASLLRSRGSISTIQAPRSTGPAIRIQCRAKHRAARIESEIEIVRFGSKADIQRCLSDVRFTPKSGHSALR